jgi:hypothetical protein
MHGILNAYSQSDLAEAAQYPGLSKAIGSALRALASESSRVTLSSTAATRSPSRVPSPSQATTANEDEILIALRSSPYFESTIAIVEFARSAGLRIQRAPKESKERLAKKVVRAMSLLPENRRSQILRELSLTRSAQTQGWIDVIKTSRNE